MPKDSVHVTVGFVGFQFVGFVSDHGMMTYCTGKDLRLSEKYAKDPHFKDLILFYEYFHGDNGRGCGAR